MLFTEVQKQLMISILYAVYLRLLSIIVNTVMLGLAEVQLTIALNNYS